MDDSSTLKYGSFFAIGIGIIVFFLGIGAYIYFKPGGQLRGLPEIRWR